VNRNENKSSEIENRLQRESAREIAAPLLLNAFGCGRSASLRHRIGRNFSHSLVPYPGKRGTLPKQFY
jgi:hypothetical protein